MSDERHHISDRPYLVPECYVLDTHSSMKARKREKTENAKEEESDRLQHN